MPSNNSVSAKEMTHAVVVTDNILGLLSHWINTSIRLMKEGFVVVDGK